MQDNDLTELMPDGRSLIALQLLRNDLDQLEDVTKALQHSEMTMLSVRYIFDEVVKTFPDTKHFLGKGAIIVKSPPFEDGICKIMKGDHATLDSIQKVIFRSFQKCENNSSIPANDTILDRAFKKVKTTESPYIDLSFIPPTSNVCERLFSLAR